jgi:hypothetical protein
MMKPHMTSVRGGFLCRHAVIALGAGLMAFLLSAHAHADGPRWRLDGGLSFSRFEQQVKVEIGGATGERLVENTEFGWLQTLSYRVWGPFEIGGFMQFDTGRREAARFSGFDKEGGTVVSGAIGGAYHELWYGPMVRLGYKRFFAEVGYGAFGARRDEARDDLPSEGGDTMGFLRTHPTIAWVLAAGGGVPINDALEVVLRLEYRLRYYDRRGSVPLADNMAHGTQSFTPFAGVAWRFGSSKGL